MSARNRLFLGAFALSVGLHGFMLAGLPGWHPVPAAEPVAAPLQARLLPPPVPEASSAVQAPADVKPRQPARPAKATPRPSLMTRPVEQPVPVAVAPAEAPAPHPDAAGSGQDAAAEIAAASLPEVEPDAEAAPRHAEPPAAPAEYPLRRVRLVYDLLHSESQTRVGHVTHTFETDGDRYEAEAVAEAVGFVSFFYRGRFVQRSRGVIGPDGLVPEEYTLERGRGDPPERAVFDWGHGKLDLAWRNERRTVTLPEGAQDPISMLHQIYFMQPIPVWSRLSVVTGRKLGEYTYQLLGEEDLITPMGLVRTLHVGRVARDGSVLEVWLDRDRELLPVRIYSRDRKGTILDQVVREVALLQ